MVEILGIIPEDERFEYLLGPGREEFERSIEGVQRLSNILGISPKRLIGEGLHFTLSENEWKAISRTHGIMPSEEASIRTASIALGKLQTDKTGKEKLAKEMEVPPIRLTHKKLRKLRKLFPQHEQILRAIYGIGRHWILFRPRREPSPPKA